MYLIYVSDVHVYVKVFVSIYFIFQTSLIIIIANRLGSECTKVKLRDIHISSALKLE